VRPTLVGIQEGNLKVREHMCKGFSFIHESSTIFISNANFFQILLEQVNEIHHFSQDDLMAEDVFILDCHSYIFVWVGQEVDAKLKTQAMDVGEVIISKLSVV
jgi:hypothetical protein